MRRKPVTLSGDLSQLVNGAILSGEFTGRSAAVRTCVQAYFSNNLVETAALVASHEELDIEDVADVLDTDREQLQNLVGAIDEDAATDELSSYLAAIESEFPNVDRDQTEQTDENGTDAK